MRPLRLSALTPWQRNAREPLYRTTHTPRLRTRAPRGLPAVAQGLKGPQMAARVREREASVRRWLKR